VAAEKANPVKPKTAAPANTPEATVQSNSKGVMTCLRFLRGFATATGRWHDRAKLPRCLHIGVLVSIKIAARFERHHNVPLMA